jgi:hypothetical protein
MQKERSRAFQKDPGWKAQRRSQILAACLAALLVLTGCRAGSGVGRSLRQMKSYVAPDREEAVFYPLRPVLVRAAAALVESRFELTLVEHLERRAFLEAGCGDRKARLSMEALTPRLTQLRCNIKDRRGLRELPAEKELLRRVRLRLGKDTEIGLPQLTRGMTPLRERPDKDTPVVGYVRAGRKIRVARKTAKWVPVKLLSGGRAYMAAERVAYGSSRIESAESEI